MNGSQFTFKLDAPEHQRIVRGLQRTLDLLELLDLPRLELDTLLVGIETHEKFGMIILRFHENSHFYKTNII